MSEMDWAVGFLETAGSFVYHYKQKIQWGIARIRVLRRDKTSLQRLQALFGGKIRTIYPYSRKNDTGYEWTITGVRAEVAMRLLLPHMSLGRQEQIRGVLVFAKQKERMFTKQREGERENR